MLRRCQTMEILNRTKTETSLIFVTTASLVSCSRPLTLFLMPQKSVCLEISLALCGNILHIFIHKVTSFRAIISPSTRDPSISEFCSTVFEPDCGPHVFHMMPLPQRLLLQSLILVCPQVWSRSSNAKPSSKILEKVVHTQLLALIYLRFFHPVLKTSF